MPVDVKRLTKVRKSIEKAIRGKKAARKEIAEAKVKVLRKQLVERKRVSILAGKSSFFKQTEGGEEQARQSFIGRGNI